MGFRLEDCCRQIPATWPPPSGLSHTRERFLWWGGMSGWPPEQTSEGSDQRGEHGNLPTRVAVYWPRKIADGSSRSARRTGMHAAPSDTAANPMPTAAKVVG